MTTVQVPLSQRVNVRLLLFMTVILGMVGFVLWKFIENKVTGGIINRGEYLEVDLYTISNFEMDQVAAAPDSVPKAFRDLDGKRVMLIGEMYQPYAVAGKISEFDLVYSISKCCVTTSPKIQHFVKARVVPGKTVTYYPNLVRVVGTLHVGVEISNDRVASVYRLEVKSTEPYQ
jgi:hypothetical protein